MTDIVFPREKCAVALEVRNQLAQREALFGSVFHESSDREDLRGQVSLEQRLHYQRVVQGVLVVLCETPQGVKSHIGPHRGVQRLPDRMMLVRLQPRHPFAPLIAKTDQS
jgi:hypothetical protein